LALTFAYPVADLAHDDYAGPPEVTMLKDDWEPYRDLDD
jgi:hypothetical protein